MSREKKSLLQLESCLGNCRYPNQGPQTAAVDSAKSGVGDLLPGRSLRFCTLGSSSLQCPLRQAVYATCAAPLSVTSFHIESNSSHRIIPGGCCFYSPRSSLEAAVKFRLLQSYVGEVSAAFRLPEICRRAVSPTLIITVKSRG